MNRTQMLAKRDEMRSKNQDLLKQIADLEKLIVSESTDRATRVVMTTELADLYYDHFALTDEIAELIHSHPPYRTSRSVFLHNWHATRSPITRAKGASRFVVAVVKDFVQNFGRS